MQFKNFFCTKTKILYFHSADSQRISDSDTPLSRPPQVKRTKQEEVVRRSSSRVSNRPKRHS